MLTLTFITCLFCASLTAPPYPCISILAPVEINPYEAQWNATCHIESNFNVNAIGDLHLKEKSYGIAQIRQTRLDDYYRKTGIRYTTKDMLDPDKSKEVFMYYASQYEPSQIEQISRCWNGGDRGMNKKSTKKYYLKIKNAL